MRLAALLLACALVPACSDGARGPDAAAGENQAAQPAPGSTNTRAAGQGGALGLSLDDLEDAELFSGTGTREIGDVERVVTDASGAVTALIVEIDDTSPDRHVQVPLDGLEVIRNGDDADLRTAMTREQLLALPEAPRR